MVMPTLTTYIIAEMPFKVAGSSIQNMNTTMRIKKGFK